MFCLPVVAEPRLDAVIDRPGGGGNAFSMCTLNFATFIVGHFMKMQSQVSWLCVNAIKKK